MSEVINNISFSERQYMLKVVDFIDSLVIKCNYDANLNETVETKREGNAYVLAKLQKDTIYDYTLTYEGLRNSGITRSRADVFKEDPRAFLNTLSSSEETRILSYYRHIRVTKYVEKNPYYLLLNGEPANESEYAYVKDIYEGEYIPIHQFSETFHSTMYNYLTNYNNQELNNVLDLFKEKGVEHEYFKYLTKRTPYETSRNAQNFEILYYDDSILDEQDMHNFFTEYARARDYVLTVPYIKSYGETMELYDRFISCTIIFITLMNFLSLKIDSIMRNKFSTREEKILFFRDYDMESIVDELTDSQLDILIENMEQLIPLKGSEEVITKILNLYGIDNISVYKYLLFKTIKSDPLTKDVNLDPKKPRKDNYDLSLVRIPIDETQDTSSVAKYIKDTTSHVDVESVFENDEYFGDTKDNSVDGESSNAEYVKEVCDKLKSSEEFSYFYTKYIGVISHINITQALIKATYLFQQLLHDSDSLETVCRVNGLASNVTCRELVAAINYIVTLRYDMDDVILNDVQSISKIMGFNCAPDLQQLKNMDSYVIKDDSPDGECVNVVLPSILDKEDIFVVRNSSFSSSYEDSRGTGGLILMAESPMLMASSAKAQCTTDYEYNIVKHDNILSKMEKTTDYDEYCALQKVFNYNMYTMAALNLFQGYDTYSEYLKANIPELYQLIIDRLNSATESQWNTIDGTQRSASFINECIELTSLFVDSILTAIGTDNDVNEAITSTYIDNTSIFSKVFSIINLFKSYTTQFSNTDVTYTINNSKDCLVKVFDMLKAHVGDDKLTESIYELIYHQITGGGSGTGEDIIVLKEWLKEHFDEDIYHKEIVNHHLDHLTMDSLHNVIGGNTGRFDNEILVQEFVYEDGKHAITQGINVKDFVESVLRITSKEAISVADKMELAENLNSNRVEQSVNVYSRLENRRVYDFFNQLQTIKLSDSQIVVRDYLEENAI